MFWLLLFGGDFTYCRFHVALPFNLLLSCPQCHNADTESNSLLCAVAPYFINLFYNMNLLSNNHLYIYTKLLLLYPQ